MPDTYHVVDAPVQNPRTEYHGQPWLSDAHKSLIPEPHVLIYTLDIIKIRDKYQASIDNPLQYSCQKNPRDRGAWQATVHGVARVGHDLAAKPPPPQGLAERGMESLLQVAVGVVIITVFLVWSPGSLPHMALPLSSPAWGPSPFASLSSLSDLRFVRFPLSPMMSEK